MATAIGNDVVAWISVITSYYYACIDVDSTLYFSTLPASTTVSSTIFEISSEFVSKYL